MHTDMPPPDESSPDPNATGAPAPLAPYETGGRGREQQERDAALSRGAARAGEPPEPLCAPDVADLEPGLLYTLVAENVRDYAIFLMDADGIIRCWGESARLLKWWTRHEAEGAHLRLLYPDGGAEDGTAESHLEAAAQTGEYNGEGHRVRSDGSTFWAYVTLTALRNPQGRLVGFTKVTRDFSARRAVEAALQRERQVTPESLARRSEENRLRRVVADLSHELRTPLNVITGSISLLERRMSQDHPDRAHIERLQRNTRHLLAIVDDFLEMSRAEAGHLPLARGVRRLGPVIEEAVADVEPQAAERNLTLTNAVSGGAGDLPYWGDEGRVRQILTNLLTNAIKFTDPGGRITVSGGTGESVTGTSLAGAGPWIYARVEDTGRGIPPENLEVIFEPFQQSQPADQHRGTGLGLSISRQLARLMGGDLTAQSELGVGSRFTLWLPIAPTEPIPR
jgi:PAS domain S-box-containing protein